MNRLGQHRVTSDGWRVTSEERTGPSTLPTTHHSPPGTHHSPPATHHALPATREVDRLTYRLDEVASSLGVSRRALERERAAGRFPRPDVVVGRMPLWRPESVLAWVERGGRP